MVGTTAYLTAYLMIFIVSVLIISFEGKGIPTTVSAVIATFNNIGPGLDVVGPTGNFSSFTPFSKFVMSMDMLLGRLEIFPILFMLSPGVWRRKSIRGRGQ